MLKRYSSIDGRMPSCVSISNKATFKNSWIEMDEASAKITIGKDLIASNANISVKEGGELVIGNLCEIQGRIIVESGSKLIIGNGLVCNGDIRIQVAEKGMVYIGNDCLFANPHILNSDMHSIYSTENNKRINQARNITIGDRVWLATNSLILKGTNLGNDTVVGAGAIVNGSFKTNVVIAGNPGKIVRENVAWSRTLTERRSIVFGEDFSFSSFRTAATNFEHEIVITQGLPYLDSWLNMDASNYFIFYYLARSLIISYFYKSPTNEIVIFNKTITLELLLEILLFAYNHSEKRNHSCGAYAYQAAVMLNKNNIAQPLYDEILPAWPHISAKQFKSPWPKKANTAQDYSLS
jgi:acetyltransferase-like isoleucine patch superfamily enzyme